MSVDEWCRFCHKYLKTLGIIGHSTLIFGVTGKAKTVFHRLVDLGLTLRKSPERSMRSCRNCITLLSRIERDLAVFRKWEVQEKQADSNEGASASTTTDKGDLETAPSKTYRAPKKTAPCEECCPEITFDISEFIFDEESNFSTEGGEAEEENICSNEEGEDEDEFAVFETGWEKEDFDQLESDNYDQLESDGSDSVLHEGLQHLCPECGVFVSTCRIHIHTCMDSNKPFSCNVCGKSCLDASALKAHSSIHGESLPLKTRLDQPPREGAHIPCATPHKCPDCSLSFSNLPALNLHVDGHSGPKVFSCPYCTLDPLTVSDTNRHVMVHTGMKQYACDFCSRSFDLQSHLKSHLRVHTGEKPFQCQHCDKSFNHTVSLKSHLVRFHKIVSLMARRSESSQPGPSGAPATGGTNSIPAVQGKALDPITTADTFDVGYLRKPSSKDIDGDWNDGDRTSELTEEDETEASKAVRKRKRKASLGPKTYYIAEKDSESDSDSSPEEEEGEKRQAVKSEEIGRYRGRPR